MRFTRCEEVLKRKFSDEALGLDQNRWFELHEKVLPTEGEKMHRDMKSAGLGELWGGPAPPVPEPEVPERHIAGRPWELLIARHYGLAPRKAGPLKHESVREAVAEFADMTHQSDPSDACKYLAIEEHRCLLAAHASGRDSEMAATECYKWFDEWRRCAWDQHKISEGISWIEPPRLRRPYMFAANRKVA